MFLRNLTSFPYILYRTTATGQHTLQCVVVSRNPRVLHVHPQLGRHQPRALSIREISSDSPQPFSENDPRCCRVCLVLRCVCFRSTAQRLHVPTQRAVACSLPEPNVVLSTAPHHHCRLHLHFQDSDFTTEAPWRLDSARVSHRSHHCGRHRRLCVRLDAVLHSLHHFCIQARDSDKLESRAGRRQVAAVLKFGREPHHLHLRQPGLSTCLPQVVAY